MNLGDRLCGDFEQVWTGMTIAAHGRVVLTNTYTLPPGKRVDFLHHTLSEGGSWHVGRNYEGRAQVHVVVREDDGAAVCAFDASGFYAMDDNNDIDDDGLPDAYEWAKTGDREGLEAYADSDGDGTANFMELVAGTDPFVKSSVFAEGAAVDAGSGMGMMCLTLTGRVYWIEAASNLINPLWIPVSGSYAQGTGGLLSILDDTANSETQRYYRLGVKMDHTTWPP